MKYVYPAIFHAGEDGWYSIRFPDLPGCYSQGKSLPEAMELAQAALSEWLQYLADENEYIPNSTSITDIETEGPTEFATLIYAETRMENVA